VGFHVRPGVLPGLYDDLRARRIELGFYAHPNVVAEEDMQYDVLLEDELAVVAGLDNPWTRHRRIKLAELLNGHWTWPPPATAFDACVIETFRACGFEPPRATVYADAINMRTRLAANGRFLAVVPAHVMKLSAKHPSLKVLPSNFPGRSGRPASSRSRTER
jgi:DNA-binding transcriptional LysR family regulator